MEFLECEREYAMYSTPKIGQVHASFKAKTLVQTEKPHGKMNSRAENERTWVVQGRTSMRPYSTTMRPPTTVRGEYHGPTVVASGRCGTVAS